MQPKLGSIEFKLIEGEPRPTVKADPRSSVYDDAAIAIKTTYQKPNAKIRFDVTEMTKRERELLRAGIGGRFRGSEFIVRFSFREDVEDHKLYLDAWLDDRKVKKPRVA